MSPPRGKIPPTIKRATVNGMSTKDYKNLNNLLSDADRLELV